MNEEIGGEREDNKEVREKTNAVTSYCNLGKLQLAIISNIYNSYRQMLHYFAFVIARAKPQLREK